VAEGKKRERAGIGAVFWITFIIFGLAVLIGIFYWVVMKPNPLPHSPERTGGTVVLVSNATIRSCFLDWKNTAHRSLLGNWPAQVHNCFQLRFQNLTSQ
jgi:hypothetical protein